MLLLKQDDIQKMAYQCHDGLYFYYGDEENLRKKFNKKLVRNYILFTLLGAAVATGAFISTKNPEIIKKILLGALLTTTGASIAFASYHTIKAFKAFIALKKEEKAVR